MQCLLQVVKWFTKCIFYSWLLKICIALSSLFSSFLFMTCFANVPTSIPADGSCHHMHQTLEAVEASCAWRQKQVHTQQSLTSFFGLQISKNVSLLQRSIQQETVTFIQPYVSLHERCRAGGKELSVLWRLCCVALSPRVKWLLFLHEHLSSSHRNKKP